MNTEAFQIVTMTVDTATLESGIHALAEYLNACTEEGITATAVLSRNNQSEGENAVEWVEQNYNPLMSGLRLAAAFADLLSAGLVNDEIKIAPAPHAPRREIETA